MSPEALLPLAVLVASAVSTRVVLHFLVRRQILDKPNERSSHSTPVPRGLGAGVIPIVLVAWMLAATSSEVRWICAGALVLMVLSWIDDVRGLPAGPRLLAQLAVTTAGVIVMGPPQLLLDLGLPLFAARALLVIVWVGLINQINFTDGIDGHLGTMLVCFGIGLFAVARAGATELAELAGLALLVAAAAAGFLIWNWHPARGFMGDVGSVPFGFLVGWILLRCVLAGHWAVALILPLFYFADTFVTYSRRIARRIAFWRPHREYLYQQAARVRRHSHIVVAVLICNLVLIGLAIFAVRGNRAAAVLIALIPVAVTYAYLARGIWWGRSLEHER
jgi:UDP-N-acetylmuramyl pentapeptide phosphotransferase/UDP-N-acetylglucosamine-1-phosphate transferase